MTAAWLLGLALAVAPALLAPASAWAQAPKRESAADIGDRQRDLQQTQKQLKEERQKAADARKREASVLSELEAIDQRLTEKRKQVVAIDGRMRRAQSDINDLQGEIGRLQTRRSGQEDVLGRRLRALYKLQAQGGVLPIVLSGDDPVNQAVQLRHLTTLATVDARLIREYRVTSEVLADRKSRVEARGKELASLKSEAEQERAEFDQEAAKRRALLSKVQDERAYHDRMVGELSEATRRLEAFIRDLQERQRRAVAKVPPPSRPASTGAGRRAVGHRVRRRCGGGSRGRRTAAWSRSTVRRSIRASGRRRSATGSTSRPPRARTSRRCSPGTSCTRDGSGATGT